MYMMRFMDLWWRLRSTTGPYGRPEIEVAYGETAISLHQGCLGDVSSGRVVGVSTWCITHGRHTRVNTSVGTVYVLLVFNTKSIRIMFSKIYIYILWKDTSGSWRCLGSMTIRKRFWPSMMFSLKKWKIYRFIVIVSLKLEVNYIFILYTVCIDFMLSL